MGEHSDKLIRDYVITSAVLSFAFIFLVCVMYCKIGSFAPPPMPKNRKKKDKKKKEESISDISQASLGSVNGAASDEEPAVIDTKEGLVGPSGEPEKEKSE